MVGFNSTSGFIPENNEKNMIDLLVMYEHNHSKLHTYPGIS